MGFFFTFILAALVVGAVSHAVLTPNRSLKRGAGLLVVYLLVGYCGVPMLAVSLWGLLSPEAAAHAFGLAAGPLFSFFIWAYLGMSIVALLALVYRGSYLVAPVVVWATYLGGATFVHVGEISRVTGTHLARAAWEIFVVHGLIAVLLVTALVLSGEWRG